MLSWRISNRFWTTNQHRMSPTSRIHWEPNNDSGVFSALTVLFLVSRTLESADLKVLIPTEKISVPGEKNNFHSTGSWIHSVWFDFLMTVERQEEKLSRKRKVVTIPLGAEKTKRITQENHLEYLLVVLCTVSRLVEDHHNFIQFELPGTQTLSKRKKK